MKEAEELELEALSNEKHEGITRSNLEKLTYLIGRLDQIKKMPPDQREGNEINITRASIQNIITRERLLQESGPVSLGSDYFLNLVPEQFKETAKEFFAKSWGGIHTATRAIELELRRNDGIEDKQVVFNDKLDANYATDYILTGRKFDDSGEEKLVAKLVQAGSTLHHKSPKDIRKAHSMLAENLRTEPAHKKTFDEVREFTEESLAEFVQGLDRMAQANESLPRLEDGAQFVINMIGEGSFSSKTITTIHNLSEAKNPSDYVPRAEYNQFRQSVYTFRLLAEHLNNSDDFQIKDIVDAVFEEAAAYGLSWVEEESEDYIRRLKQSLGESTAAFLRKLEGLDLLEEVSYNLKSCIVTRFKDEESERKLPKEQEEVDINVDNKLSVMYRINKKTLSNLLKQI